MIVVLKLISWQDTEKCITARGALFRLTLQSYGYVFVAKETVLACNRDLKHEAQVYHHLQDIQGGIIPVYIGSVDLQHCYFLDAGVRIVHMLLMSWGGEAFHGDSISSLDTRTRKCVKDTEATRSLWSQAPRHQTAQCSTESEH